MQRSSAAGAKNRRRATCIKRAIGFWRRATAVGWGEIDLIAQKGRELAFVEVKLRRNARFAEPREQVTAAKQRRILLAARNFLAQHPEYGEYYCRFDVAEVYAPDGLQTAKPEIRYYEHAFW